MKITLERDVLLKTLSHVLGAVEKRNTIPVLSFILVQAKNSQVTFTATDLDLVISETIDSAVEKDGEATIQAHTLFDIARKLADKSTIDIQSSEGRVTLISGRSRYKLASLPSRDFPNLETQEFPHHFKLPASELLMLIDKTRFAISTEETRYYLNGIYLHAIKVGDETLLRSVATDGHRLAQTSLPLPEGAENIPGVIVPRKTVENLRKLLDDHQEAHVEISLSENAVRFNILGAFLTSKLIDGTFPNYERVIPTNNDKTILLDRAQFSHAIDRVSVVATDKTKAVKLSFKSNLLTLTSNSQENDSAREEIEAPYEADPVEIGFNVRYLLDVAHNVDSDDIQIAMSESSAPVIVTGTNEPNTLYVLMPMRV